ncbi:MAG: hypothetical protein AAFQ44_05275 [Pseudomonadota bacterium]
MTFRPTLFVISTLVAFAVLTAWTSAMARPCHSNAISSLKRFSPDGYAVYRAYRNKRRFLGWIDSCRDMVGGVVTAVHETVHMLTHQWDAYPLINGERLPRVPEARAFFPPRLVAKRFPRSSPFVESYLVTGQASSADYLRYLLDELNAYAHDLNTAVRMNALEARGQTTFHRDGLAALMAFLAAYIDEAARRRRTTWRALMQPQHRRTVVALWAQAEDVMGRSCHVRDLGYEASRFLRPVCSVTAHDPLGVLLGRPPLCPIRCALQ